MQIAASQGLARLAQTPLVDRKAILARSLKCASGIHLSEHDDGDGEALFGAVCRMRMEGVVSERLSSVYHSGRSSACIKIQNKHAADYLRVQDGLDG